MPSVVNQLVSETDRLGTASELRTVQRNGRIALAAPIIVLEAYLISTILVFFFGPLEWHIPSPAKLILFLAINYGGLWVGFRLGIKKRAKTLLQGRISNLGEIRLPPQVIKLLLWSMIFNILSALIRLYAVRGGFGAALSTLLSPGQAYQEAEILQQIHRETGTDDALSGFSWAFRISTVLSVLNSLYFPLGLVAWQKLSLTYKAVFCVSVSCTVAFYVGLGAQSGIGALLFAALPVVLYKVYVVARPITIQGLRSLYSRSRTTGGGLWAKILALALLLFLIGTVVFFQVDRADNTLGGVDITTRLGSGFCTVSETGLLQETGGKVNFGLVMLCMYVSHGYAGLAFAMECPFQWTYGLGSSMALATIVHNYLGGPDMFERSYLVRNEDENGWPALSWWSTIFPWIASDTTFFGTVFFMIGVGMVIGRCWTNVIFTGNPLGFAMLAQMFTLVFMIPANNYLVQSLENLFSLIGLVLIYLISGKYFKPRSEVA